MDYSMGKPPSTVKNEKTVKYMKNRISTTISIVALGIAIVAMAKVAPAHELDFDYYGAIIGVLSFLVTLLMGYQIYTVINVKKDMDEVRIVKKEIDTKLHEKAQVLSKEYRDELSQAVPLLITISSPDREGNTGTGPCFTGRRTRILRIVAKGRCGSICLLLFTMACRRYLYSKINW